MILYIVSIAKHYYFHNQSIFTNRLIQYSGKYLREEFIIFKYNQWKPTMN